MNKKPKTAPAEMLPGPGHNYPARNQRQDIVAAITEILLRERASDVPCFLDSIFEKACVTIDIKSTARDVITTDLLLFEEGRSPNHNNLYNADLGNFTEKIVATLFQMTRGDTVDASIATMQEIEQQSEALRRVWFRKYGRNAKFPSWKKGDFLLGSSTIVECKYRFRSCDAKYKQIKVAELYKELGLSPVFLHLSPDFRDADVFQAGGWEVHCGEGMIEYIEHHTGYNLRDLLREVSAQPVVRQRIIDAHAHMIEEQKGRLWRDYKFAPEEVRLDFTRNFANHAPGMHDLADQIEIDPPPDITIRIDGLRNRTKALCDEVTLKLPQEKRDALLGIILTLDEDQRAELLSEVLSRSSGTTQMTVMSVFG